MALFARGQTVTVTDEITRELLIGVWISDGSLKVESNAKGEADISALKGDSLTVSLGGYETLRTSRSALARFKPSSFLPTAGKKGKSQIPAAFRG